MCSKNIGRQIKKFDKRIKNKLPKISNINNVNWKKIDLLFYHYRMAKHKN